MHFSKVQMSGEKMQKRQNEKVLRLSGTLFLCGCKLNQYSTIFRLHFYSSVENFCSRKDETLLEMIILSQIRCLYNEDMGEFCHIHQL